MKKIYFSLLGMALVFSTFQASAQVHLGVTTGVNSTFVLDKGLSEDPRYNSTMTYNFSPVGFAFGVNISDGFGLQLETILANQGQIYEIIDIAKKVVGERKVDLEYIQLPILFKFMSSSANPTRANFSIGPQFSFLTSGSETMYYEASTQFIENEYEVPAGTSPNPDGSYDLPALSETEVLNTLGLEELKRFKEQELQISASFGVDFDLARNIYLTTLIRANYGITDMRNKDLIEYINENNYDGLLSKSANLAVGIQLGLHYMFGGTRSFNAKQATKDVYSY